MDTAGFDEWYRECRARTVAGLWALGADRELAEECAAEAFARALARWPRVREMDHPRRWLQIVALNLLRRAQRRRAMERAVLLGHRTDHVVDDPDAHSDLWLAVRQLPRRQQVAVTLRYAADLTEDDVAAVMGVTRGTVASTLHDARHSLAQLLRSNPDQPEVWHG
jgi:RNA polymerase sigma factor (sigma-70 family)